MSDAHKNFAFEDTGAFDSIKPKTGGENKVCSTRFAFRKSFVNLALDFSAALVYNAGKEKSFIVYQQGEEKR